MEDQSLNRSSKRRNSWKKSFHSIDQFRENPIDNYGRANRFPVRPCINILLILLTTIEVYILLSSRIYLRGELVRTFLSAYIDNDQYPELFQGNEFYLQVVDVGELKDHFEYLFKRVNQIQNDSFIDLNYGKGKFLLHTEYKSLSEGNKRETIHEIDPKIGIIKPFDMRNTTSLQLYLLQVEQFQLRVDNLTMKQNWQGFSERYYHEITYQYVNSIKVRINFNFRISNALVGEEDDPQELGETPFPTIYIIKVRVFYGIIMFLSVLSLYLNYLSIRTTFKVLYEQMGQSLEEDQNKPQEETLLQDEEIQIIREDVRKWVHANQITFHEMKYQHYFHLIEFDVLFSVMSNVFQIIANFYLISGIEKERIAGVACLFSWLTIFKFIRNYKKLVLMYQLIKLSITKVVMFFVEFLPVFLSYAVLGVCLFPKVSFFSSLADSVTTLVCLMMGDSIQMITLSIIEKDSTIMAIVYIFTFVLMFMHAIHNTLTSLIKEFFIIKKIELVNEEKKKNQETDYLYIEEIKTKSQIAKNQLPLKLTSAMQKNLLRVQTLKKLEAYSEIIKFYWSTIDRIRVFDSWVINECNLKHLLLAKEEIIRRALKTKKVTEIFIDLKKSQKKLPKALSSNNRVPQERKSEGEGENSSLITEHY